MDGLINGYIPDAVICVRDFFCTGLQSFVKAQKKSSKYLLPWLPEYGIIIFSRLLRPFSFQCLRDFPPHVYRKQPLSSF